MKLPGCFYTKAFWIVVPLLTVSMAGSVAAVNSQLESNTQYDYSQDNRINYLTETLNDKITQMYGNQMIICEKVGANCK